MDASELVKANMRVAIDRANAEREEFEIEKERYHQDYIKTKIEILGKLIRAYPTDKSKWDVNVFLDMETLKRRVYQLESCQLWGPAELWRKHIKYYDAARIKNTFIELGYGLEEEETIVNKFLCIPDYKQKIHRLYIK